VTRIEIIDRADMDAEQAQVHDAAKESGDPVGGPFYAYIRIPDLFQKAQDMRDCLGAGPLSERERLIVFMVVARHWNARYPWFAQSRNALAIGIERDIVDAINAREVPSLADDRERTSYEVARELMESNELSDVSYAAAEAVMGLDDLVGLVAASGQFVMTCCTANAFEVDPPADEPAPLRV
jgi:4-carboxymuconolactone decarboxylase